MTNKILIAGVGNSYRRDDGIGPAIIKILVQQKLSQFELLDVGTDGFLLLDQLPRYQQAIIIDAVTMGEAPGTVKIFTPEEARLHIKRDALSTHGFGLAEILKLFDGLNEDVESSIKILGIEPSDVGYGEGLSDVVQDKVPQILAAIETI